MRAILILVLVMFSVSANAQGRPLECYIKIGGKLIPWCGCAMSLRYFGEVRMDLLRARGWLKLGHPIKTPISGAIAVYARGKTGGHVGTVTAVTGPHTIVLWSGNDGGEIRERERSTHGIIGYRML